MLQIMEKEILKLIRRRNLGFFMVTIDKDTTRKQHYLDYFTQEKNSNTYILVSVYSLLCL